VALLAVEIANTRVRVGEPFHEFVIRRELAHRIRRARFARDDKRLAATAAKILFAPLA
jgi:hypothetical protein